MDPSSEKTEASKVRENITATAETFAQEKNTPRWLFAAVRAANRWPIGREMTESDYDAAVKKVQHLPIGG